jgi:hypothetical protein
MIYFSSRQKEGNEEKQTGNKTLKHLGYQRRKQNSSLQLV